MKIKVYVIDVDLSPRARKIAKRVAAGIVISLLVLAGGAIAYASALHTWADGDVLKAADLNASFQAVAPPPKAVVLTTLSAADLADTTKFDGTGLGTGAYSGWAVCNGNNGTTNLTGRLPRMVSAGAGATGGEDTNAHTHGMQNHTHGYGTYQACLLGYYGDGTMETSNSSRAGSWMGNYEYSFAGLSGSASSRNTDSAIDIIGSSGTPSNNTTTAASDTENRPAFYELVPLCKL